MRTVIKALSTEDLNQTQGLFSNRHDLTSSTCTVTIHIHPGMFRRGRHGHADKGVTC